MDDLVGILEGKTSTDVGKHVPVKRGIKILFYMAVYIEDMQGTFFYTCSLYVIKIGVTGKKSKTIDQQGNISIFTSRCIKKDN